MSYWRVAKVFSCKYMVNPNHYGFTYIYFVHNRENIHIFVGLVSSFLIHHDMRLYFVLYYMYIKRLEQICFIYSAI